MEEIRSNGEQKELRDEIVDLGTRFGIVTPYTSFLAIEEKGAQEITRTPPLRRSGVIAGNVMAAPSADLNASTGRTAVLQSKKTREMLEAERISTTDSSSVVRTVAGKTFYLRDKIWTDAEFKPDGGLPETVIRFGSDDYFALLKSNPRIAQFFALGEQVIVVLDGRVYRVTAAVP